MQRLDEELDEDVPERTVEETLVVEPVEGTPADLPSGPIAVAVPTGAGRAATASAS